MMTDDKDYSTQKPVKYMAFYKEDLQFMAGDTISYGHQEHGFSLFGSKTHGDNFLCMLAVSAGPNATRNAVNFHDDHEFIMEVSRYLLSHYGIQYVGNNHSHHDLGLSGPSGNDQRQIYNVATKNNINSLGQIIMTYEYHEEFDGQNESSSDKHQKLNGVMKQKIGTTIKQFWRSRPKIPFVKFNSYIYPDAQSGTYQPMKIKLLEGTNPIRAQLLQTEFAEFIETNDGNYFPMERIIIDEYVTDVDDGATNVPDALSKKLLTLPEEILGHSKISLQASYLAISFEIADRYMITAKYSIDEDCPLKKITLGQDNLSMDLTEYVSKFITTDNLSEVYETMLKIIQDNFCKCSGCEH